MRRVPTWVDVDRWTAILAKVGEAQAALREADAMLGLLIPTLSGDDDESLEIVGKLGRALELARMAAGNIQHPVAQQWAGSKADGRGGYTPYTHLVWRY